MQQLENLNFLQYTFLPVIYLPLLKKVLAIHDDRM